MVALVSSTIFPSDERLYGGDRSRLSFTERLDETIATVNSLVRCGITSILIADNSGRRWDAEVTERLKPARTLIFDHPNFRNKGIAELYLILVALQHLDANVPIIKLSGRYILQRAPVISPSADLLVKYRDRHRTVSTRCYVAANRTVLQDFATEVLRQVYRSPYRIVGPRSLFVAIA